MYSVQELQEVKLVDGTFTPSESMDVISHLINAKINFHKMLQKANCLINCHKKGKRKLIYIDFK